MTTLQDVITLHIQNAPQPLTEADGALMRAIADREAVKAMRPTTERNAAAADAILKRDVPIDADLETDCGCTDCREIATQLERLYKVQDNLGRLEQRILKRLHQ